MKSWLIKKTRIFARPLLLSVFLLVITVTFAYAQTSPPGGTQQPLTQQPAGGSSSAPPGGAAQTSPATPAVSALGSAILDALGGLAFPAVAAIAVVFFVLNGILSALLAIVGGILDLAWQANVSLDPSNMIIVQQGWRIVRDISNAFFILIVLWIAFTIIFNLERFKGKELLVRTVVVAFLINFSLVFVTIVFGFTNSLANEFAKKVPTGDIAGTFISSTQLHTVFNRLGQGEAQTLAEAKARRDVDTIAREEAEALHGGVPSGTSPATGNPRSEGPNLKQTFFAALGVPQADAQVLTGLAGCGIGFVVGGPAGCVVGGIGAALMSVLNRFTGGPITFVYKLVISQALSSLLFLLTIAAFLLASVALIARLVAEILLSILAPAALMVHLIPGKATSQYWDQWVDALFRYAFFAPMFYFLMYLTLYILQTSNQRLVESGGGQITTNAATDFDRFVQVFLALALIYAAVKLSRKTGGVLAEAAITAGKFAGSQALGFAGRAALPRLGALAARMDRGVSGMKDVSIKGWRLPTVLQPRQMFGYPSRGLQAVTRMGRAQQEEAEKQPGSLTAKDIKRGFATGMFRTQAERTAAIRKLQQFGDLSLDTEIPGFTKEHLRAAVDQIKSLNGDYKPLLRANPTIATLKDYSADDISEAKKTSLERTGAVLGDDELAQWITWTKTRPEHIKDIDLNSALKTEEQMKLFLAVAQPAVIGSLVRHNPVKGKEVNDVLNKEDVAKELIPRMDAGKFRYFSTNAGRELGLTLPPDIAEELLPKSIQDEKVARKSVEQAKNAVNDAETALNDAKKSKKEVVDLKNRAKDLNEQTQDLEQEAASFEAAGNQKRARDIREITIPQTNRTLAQVNRNLARAEEQIRAQYAARVEGPDQDSTLFADQAIAVTEKDVEAKKGTLEAKRKKLEGFGGYSSRTNV